MKNLRYNEKNNHKCLPSPRVRSYYSKIKASIKDYPNFITGFSDGESTFSFSICKARAAKIG
jgi:hypothetical protein